MRQHKVLSVLVLSLIAFANSVQSQQPRPGEKPKSTTSERRASPKTIKPLAASMACNKKLGIVGGYFEADMTAFLTANGVSVTNVTGTLPGSLSTLDVLYVDRTGTAAATTHAAAIESWVRGGGTLITEFDSTTLLFNGTFGFFPPATLDIPFGVPSGSVCGGNTVNVTSPGNALAAGLPASWPCSGDPIGVFKVYKESTLDPAVDRVVRANVDQNQDGAKDPVVGAACVDSGAVVAFFTDFGDWQPLQNPRTCPNPPCNRSIEDETLMLNAVCRARSSCKAQDHFLCYKIKPAKDFRPRDVIVQNQFGEQAFTVYWPELLCVPSTKTEVKR